VGRNKHNVFLWVISVIILFQFNTYADTVAFTESGQKIILKDNGVWQYATQADTLLSGKVEIYEVSLEKEQGEYEFENKIKAYFQFRNNTAKEVAAINFDFVITNPFGKIIYQDDDVDWEVSISPGEISAKDIHFSWNGFSQTYSKLAVPVSQNAVKTTVKVNKVAFSDGTIEIYNKKLPTPSKTKKKK